MNLPYRRNTRTVRHHSVRGIVAAVAAMMSLSGTAMAASVGYDVGAGAEVRTEQARERASSVEETPSTEARAVADWIMRSSDNQDLPFIVVDKSRARLFLFDRDGTVRATAPVLLGLARGDDSPPGVGELALSKIKPADRITPAGRFFASMGEDLSGRDILWIDYGAAVALHRLSDPVPGLTAGGRQARLMSASIDDNRISHGCVNVSVDFFDNMIRPTFGRTGGIVYVLPETRSIQAVFQMRGAHRDAKSVAFIAGRAS